MMIKLFPELKMLYLHPKEIFIRISLKFQNVGIIFIFHILKFGIAWKYNHIKLLNF